MFRIGVAPSPSVLRRLLPAGCSGATHRYDQCFLGATALAEDHDPEDQQTQPENRKMFRRVRSRDMRASACSCSRLQTLCADRAVRDRFGPRTPRKISLPAFITATLSFSTAQRSVMRKASSCLVLACIKGLLGSRLRRVRIPPHATREGPLPPAAIPVPPHARPPRAFGFIAQHERRSRLTVVWFNSLDARSPVKGGDKPAAN